MGRFWEFLGAVWRHWEARFGTTFAVILAAAQYTILAFVDSKKVPGWVRDFPPYLWLAIGASFLVWSFYAAWREKADELVKFQGELDANRPRIALIPSRLRSGRWFDLAPNGYSVFRMVHISGDPAEHIQVQPIPCFPDGKIDLVFKQVDYLNASHNEENLSYRIYSQIAFDRQKWGSHEDLIYIFLRNRGEEFPRVVDFPVRISFYWRGRSLEDQCALRWNPADQTLEVLPMPQ